MSRPAWPWLTGAAVAGMVASGAVVGLVAGLASGSPSTLPPLNTPEEVVLVWDASFRDNDCSAFRRTTTRDFRAAYSEEFDYGTCSGFREGNDDIAEDKPDDFWETYEIEVLEVEVDGDRATVEVEESWEYLDSRDRVKDESDEYTYHLVLVDGQWRINDASFIDPGATVPV